MPRKKKITAPGASDDTETLNRRGQSSVLNNVPKNRISVEHTLNTIYGKDAGNRHALFDKHHKQRGVWLWIMLIFFAVFAGIAWLGYFLFSSSNKLSDNDATFTIDAPSAVPAGMQAAYTITYSNNFSVPLANAGVFLKYPEGFVYAKAEPEPSDKEHRQWNLGTLPPNTTRSITLEGTLWGNKGETAVLQGFFNYRPANFNADFQKTASANTVFSASPLEISFTGPETARVGNVLTYVIAVKNPENKPFENTRISLAYPQGFVLQNAEPAASKEQNTWEIGSLGAQETKTISLKGSFGNSAKIENKIFALAQTTAHDDKIYTQQTIEFATQLETAELGLELKAGGSTSAVNIAQGDKIAFVISLKNTSGNTLTDALLRFNLEGASDGGKSLFNWALIDDKSDGTITGEQVSSTIRRGIITWSKKEIPALGILKPGENINISFILPVKDKNSFDPRQAGSASSKAYAELLNSKAGAAAVVKSNEVALALMTNLVLNAEARFKEKKSSIDGEENIYTITWTIENSVHEVNDIQIAALLPDGVRWLNKTQVSAGAITFDTDSKQARWKINRIPTSFPKTVILFDIAASIPKGENSTREILGTTRLEAYDKTASGSIFIEKGALTAAP